MPSPEEKPSVPPAAKPRFGNNFDPYNSSATGHQRPDNTPGATTGWRASRARKLSEQFAGGNSGGIRMSDTYGAGSEDFDEKLKMVVPKDVRMRAKMSVADMLARPGLMRSGSSVSEAGSVTSSTSATGGNLKSEEEIVEARRKEDEEKEAKKAAGRGLFEGVTVYVNGSTHPVISDHRLKRVLVENGARMAIHLGRRQVTHVIVGRPAGIRAGAGGGLASGKLDKEIRKVGGCAVKYVGVEWVMESLKAGSRLPEVRFAPLKVAREGQRSVYGMYGKHSSGESPTGSAS
ncbi:BRCA1 C Terminus domain-containing protein [Colletotrichum tofieldiae]|uniref:BRCA1 C Terminus domain-containing protein n=1 Tax=Colletotrichum tofieldiae TaxID=708197 RepID=A0A166X230_9PEZI|nr:BRCA1 C Terminus domain-containing protein [Colletotrichum tofieldiae]GKT60413.1 BRCA1 C Terminus domain-containing protein [Colletotrichum tofieldiae]GKT68123.1 BRCA1 C Terminus domain-containing protein [Colletotrichum tofieldiae]